MSDDIKGYGSVILHDGKRPVLVRFKGGSGKIEGGGGSISAATLEGKGPGDRIRIGSREFTLVRPDILDHLVNLKRGAQIILPKDASYIVLHLGLRSGDTVIEAGAGSGGSTLVLLNTVAPGGMVLTYDIRKEHLDLTAENVARSGLSSSWEGRLGDIKEARPQVKADAFLLDIPDPENALTTAKEALKPGGRLCCYLPTFNQVERCHMAMERTGFIDIRAVELLERTLSVKEGATRPSTEMLGHTGYLVFGRKLS
ncbi:MAG: tRNA (adenine-N1)-methyltransferase [Candidatus Thermoplasmatota archaeon]|nr:tRNA (adenine-N1)-methyltransferase [Candidatus Thermoplasmatota archaeon]